MKLRRLDETKKLFPHFYDKTNDSNFTKHLSIINNQQLDIYHKLKTIDWSRSIEKPIQIWKEQNKKYDYTIHFKVLIPNLKEVNVYKNPIISDDTIINSEISKLTDISKVYQSDNTNFYEGIYEGTSELIIPNDAFVIEVVTWDDYKWLKGFPENDYVKQDSSTKYGTTLHYRESESFIDISIEEISYSKYLTFRVHQDGIRKIQIFKNNDILIDDDFTVDLTTNTQFKSTDSSYTYFDRSTDGVYDPDYPIYEIETKNGNYTVILNTEKDEYIYRVLLKNSDFVDNNYVQNILKDLYDIEVTVSEKRYKCNKKREVIYRKRYNGYDNVSGDCFDHDYSLDMIGTLLNVPRFHFYSVISENLYNKTYPSFNNRVSEDDYHYMKRLQYYIQNYNSIYFPVLEFWKYYYTSSELVNRKVKLARQGQAHFRTKNDDCFVMGDALVEEEFSDEELINEYTNTAMNTVANSSTSNNLPSFTINKATTIRGKAEKEERVVGYSWAESVIINKLFIVPSANYRLRYGVSENQKDVTVLIHGYNREGQLIRSNEFTPSDDDSIFYTYHDDELVMEYNVKEDYTYYNLELGMPSDTSYIEVLLQSDESFKYDDVTFERETIALKENLYLDNKYGYYNSCTYDLYADYYDIPTNLRLDDTERFNSLFNRSLPLTKQGIFHLIINEESDTSLALTDEYSLTCNDLFGADSMSGDGQNHYIIDITDFIKEGCTYHISFHCLLNEHFKYEFIPNGDSDDKNYLDKTPDYLIQSYIEWYDIDNFIDVEDLESHLLHTEYCENKVDTDIEGIVSYSGIAVDESKGARIHIISDNVFKYWDLKFKRDEKLTEDELIRG